MRNSILYIIILSSLFLSSCNDDSVDKDNSIFANQDVSRNAFDRWLLNNYVYPYNIDVKYRMEDLESTMSFILAPATYEKSVALSKIVKHVWLEAYDEVAGINFMRSYVPRTIHIIGSQAYNQNGTTVLGTAEGGMKITLYNVNNINPDYLDIEQLNTYYFRTMHHEFAHILHQTRNYDPAFERITESSYLSDSWYIYQDPVSLNNYYRTDEQAWVEGFVTPYAMSEPREDFVETITTYITHDQAYWENILEEAGEEGARLINAKFAVVYSYMKNTWNIDLTKLREIVIRRQNEVTYLDLKI